jgi:hypothetical protein
VDALIDTGASRSLCSQQLYEDYISRNHTTKRLEEADPLVTITGQPLKVIGKFDLRCNRNVTLMVSVVVHLPIPLLLGTTPFLGIGVI